MGRGGEPLADHPREPGRRRQRRLLEALQELQVVAGGGARVPRLVVGLGASLARAALRPVTPDGCHAQGHWRVLVVETQAEDERVRWTEPRVLIVPADVLDLIRRTNQEGRGTAGQPTAG